MLSTQREDLSVIPKYPREKPELAVLVILELGGGTDRRIPGVGWGQRGGFLGKRADRRISGGYRQEDPWSGYQQEDPWGEGRTDGNPRGREQTGRCLGRADRRTHGGGTDRKIPGFTGQPS